MPNGAAIQNYTGASGDERICMKLLVPKCRHVGLIAGNELIEIVKLPSKARADMVGRKESHITIQRLKFAEV
jgi:hypothetical protein